MKFTLYFLFGALLGAALIGCSSPPLRSAPPALPPPEVAISLSTQEFWLAVIAAIGSVLSSLVLSVVNLQKLKTVHLDLNSRLGEMLENRMAEGRAQGELDARSPRPMRPPEVPSRLDAPRS